jgi:hypothetical protein
VSVPYSCNHVTASEPSCTPPRSTSGTACVSSLRSRSVNVIVTDVDSSMDGSRFTTPAGPVARNIAATRAVENTLDGSRWCRGTRGERAEVAGRVRDVELGFGRLLRGGRSLCPCIASHRCDAAEDSGAASISKGAVTLRCRAPRRACDATAISAAPLQHAVPSSFEVADAAAAALGDPAGATARVSFTGAPTHSRCTSTAGRTSRSPRSWRSTGQGGRSACPRPELPARLPGPRRSVESAEVAKAPPPTLLDEPTCHHLCGRVLGAVVNHLPGGNGGRV